MTPRSRIVCSVNAVSLKLAVVTSPPTTGAALLCPTTLSHAPAGSGATGGAGGGGGGGGGYGTGGGGEAGGGGGGGGGAGGGGSGGGGRGGGGDGGGGEGEGGGGEGDGGGGEGDGGGGEGAKTAVVCTTGVLTLWIVTPSDAVRSEAEALDKSAAALLASDSVAKTKLVCTLTLAAVTERLTSMAEE